MRKYSCLFVLCLAIASGFAPVAMAQTTPPQADSYVVQKGDTLYQLSATYKGDPLKWHEVLGANPFLKEPGRVYDSPDGKTIVVIRLGEVLQGLASIGVEATVLPFEKLKLPEEKKADAPAATPSFWGWLILALFAIAVATFATFLYTWWRRGQVRLGEVAARERELTRDPVTSGPPIVAGGIPATDTARLAAHFADQAVAGYVARTPGADAAAVRPNIVRIGPVEEGMISGEGMVGYADRARPRRIVPPQPGYRARFRFPDGREDNLMSLQGCMNPCFYGEGLSGFTFTPGRVAVPTPEPPTPAPQAVPHPAIAVARTRAAAEAESASTVLVGGKIITIERGAHFDLDSVPGSVRIFGGAFDMTVKPRRRERRAAVDPTAREA